ncbi:cytochrome C biogenesis protein [Sphingopyxis sp. FD7]|nr:cytochrome C biogenesis protein [Sphingopyxis sp. FD7]
MRGVQAFTAWIPAKAGIQSGTMRRGFNVALDPRFRGGALLFLALLFAVPSFAQDRLPPAPYAYQQLNDPAKEARAKALMEELRCLVCQGQSIADSDAPLAGDMRHEVRSKIAAGESPDEIKAWLVARYGNWVTYDPPFDAATALLWLGPLLFLAIGGWLAFGRFRRGDGDAEDKA